MGHKDLRLGKIVYILVFYNTSFTWLLLLDGFQNYFFAPCLLCDSENELLKFCQNAVFSKIDVNMTTINKKNFEIDKIRTLHDLDLLLKIRHQEVKVWCLANNLREK